MNEIKQLLLNRYGVNNQINGEYDKELSAKCTNGVFVGAKTGDVVAFRGIPFAKPPVGNLRWKAPRPVEYSNKVFEAYYNGKSPIQTEWRTEQASYYPQGEDCLYLNIWTNTADNYKNKSVMVFFHGGSYGWGGTADPMYDGKNLVSKQSDIILVTVGYRIGITGFIDLSSLKGGDKYPDAPNLGILDQIEALRWIRKNIASFGGNPDNVTIFGESAGGGSVSLLPIIPAAKGLFRRVIAESGSVALTFSKKECQSFTKKIVNITRAKSVDDLLKLTEDELKAVNEEVNSYNNFPQRDGKLIPLNPYVPYENGYTKDVDILIGTNSNEMNYWIDEVGGLLPYQFSMKVKYENDLKILSSTDRDRVKYFMSLLEGQNRWKLSEFYNEIMFRLPAIKQAKDHAANGGKSFMYYWTVPSALPRMKACHAVELAYVFGNIDETLYIGERADEELSDTVMQMWTNFARIGDPSTEDIEWPAYTAKDRTTIILSKEPHTAKAPLKQQHNLLFPLLRYMINPSYAELNYNVPFVRKIVGGVAAVAAITASVILINKLK